MYLEDKDFGHEVAGFRVYMTSANITLFQYYGMIPCDAKVGKSGNFSERSGLPRYAHWAGVPDNDSIIPLENDNGNISIADLVVQNDFECFGSFETILSAVGDYIYDSSSDSLASRPGGFCPPGYTGI